MHKHAPPSFPCYASDWLGSTRVSLMTLEQQGAYFRLLCHQWADPDCSLTVDDGELAMLSSAGSRWGKLREKIMRCFEPHPNMPDRLANPKLLEIRQKQAHLAEIGGKGGRKSAGKRWGGKQTGNQSVSAPLTDGLANGNGAAVSQPLTQPQANCNPHLPASGLIPPAPLSGRKKPARPKSEKKPDDVTLTDELRAYAIKKGLPAEEVEEVWEEFGNHTFDKPKSDWAATWRNWASREARYRRERRRNGASDDADPYAHLPRYRDCPDCGESHRVSPDPETCPMQHAGAV